MTLSSDEGEDGGVHRDGSLSFSEDQRRYQMDPLPVSCPSMGLECVHDLGGLDVVGRKKAYQDVEVQVVVLWVLSRV